MAELAAQHHRQGGRKGFVAPRREIADAAGVSLPTLDKHVALLQRLGLLTIERRRERGVNLPGVWSLSSAEGLETQLATGQGKRNSVGTSRTGDFVVNEDERAKGLTTASSPSSLEPKRLKHHSHRETNQDEAACRPPGAGPVRRGVLAGA